MSSSLAVVANSVSIAVIEVMFVFSKRNALIKKKTGKFVLCMEQ